MRFYADFHIHSSYSRATSRDMVPGSIHRWAQLKGLGVVGTGDFTHPRWFAELKRELNPLGNGLLELREEYAEEGVPAPCTADVFFLLTAEISCIYSKAGRTRKVHCLVMVPDFESAARLNLILAKIGNISSDGRPILGLDAKELLRLTVDACPDALFVPAHIWTPHFSVFGAASGFDSLDECFEELTPHIRALETGLSSDPSMNWRLSSLDGRTLISNSDAHSCSRMGREANVLDTDLSYPAIKDAIERGRGFLGTIEFFPEEGKYHWDGHRACGVCLAPAETRLQAYRCPKCGKPLTVGVMHRVEALADRPAGVRPPERPGFRPLVPLVEIIAEAMDLGRSAKAVDRQYTTLLSRLGSEFTVLMEAALSDIERASTPAIAEAVTRMREGKIHISPGYDGEYGKIMIFDGRERSEAGGQMRLL